MTEPDAAVAIVHARATDAVLLMRRAEREEDAWSGHWSFPGGRREPSDRDLLFTALRELEEECGIRLSPGHLEAALPVSLARRRVGKFLHVAPFVLRVNQEMPAIPDACEAVQALWLPLAVLKDPTRHSLRPVPGLPPEALFPSIDLNGVPLWGFTYRLLADWLALNPEDNPGRRAGFRAAQDLLNVVLSHGCKLECFWEFRDAMQVAEVTGTIPVKQAIAVAAAPEPHIPRVNMLAVLPDRIRVVGLGFEEYEIRATR
jgi:8-oxo-dGTP pyrophosphatase MutT (NUDIX family)